MFQIKNQRISSVNLFKICNYAFLTVFGILLLYPFLRTLLVSVTPGNELIYANKSIIHIPKSFSTNAYEIIFETNTIPQSYKITIFVTILGTVLSMLVSILTAYPLSVKEHLPGKKLFQFLIVFTMLFNSGVIPLYIVVKSLGLIDTIFALILPSLLNSFFIIVMRTYFSSIPYSLHESAKLDGCNDFFILFSIIIPLSKPMILTITLFYAIGYWNAFFNAIMYINNSSLYTLPVLLRMILLQSQSTNVLNIVGDSKALNTSIRAAIIMATCLPILVIYPMIQKHFITGLNLGAVKE